MALRTAVAIPGWLINKFTGFKLSSLLHVGPGRCQMSSQPFLCAIKVIARRSIVLISSQGGLHRVEPALLAVLLEQYRQLCAAVSYTHLRAHETPEHLVCRLL